MQQLAGEPPCSSCPALAFISNSSARRRVTPPLLLSLRSCIVSTVAASRAAESASSAFLYPASTLTLPWDWVTIPASSRQQDLLEVWCRTADLGHHQRSFSALATAPRSQGSCSRPHSLPAVAYGKDSKKGKRKETRGREILQVGLPGGQKVRVMPRVKLLWAPKLKLFQGKLLLQPRGELLGLAIFQPVWVASCMTSVRRRTTKLLR